MNEVRISLSDNRECPSLTVVVPCYNESEIFPFCLEKLSALLRALIKNKAIASTSYILFVDDGSRDGTWQKIQAAVQTHKSLVRGIKLSCNKGHQIALMAGLFQVRTDVCVSIDADLQDDVACIPIMIAKYKEGKDVVYGVRNDRGSDTFFKRLTANGFYKFMDIMGIQQIANHADFRLLSKKALGALLSYHEQNVYIRGLVPLIGFSSDKVFYARDVRIAGETKYPLGKMLSLAFEGITSFSVVPLRFIAFLGLIVCFLSLTGCIYVLYSKIRGGEVLGWASVELSIFFFGGVQLLSLGIIGEYIGKIYLESKRRPKFFIADEV